LYINLHAGERHQGSSIAAMCHAQAPAVLLG
jgi:hypothetical protein